MLTSNSRQLGVMGDSNTWKVPLFLQTNIIVIGGLHIITYSESHVYRTQTIKQSMIKPACQINIFINPLREKKTPQPILMLNIPLQ